MELFRKVIKYGLIVIGSFILAGLCFHNLSDIGKAKISTQILGLHKSNMEKLRDARELLLIDDFEKCIYLDSIDITQKKLIEHFKNKNYSKSIDSEWTEISDIYARNEEEWNAGCTIFGDQPTSKFEYILYSENSIIICSRSGGFASSYWYEFYKIKSDKLEQIAILNTPNNSIFDLTLFMRFEGDMIEWKREEQERLIEVN